MRITLRAFECALNTMIERVTRPGARGVSGPRIAGVSKFYAIGLARSTLGTRSKAPRVWRRGTVMFQRSDAGRATRGVMTAEAHRMHEQMR
jgi:hypothetical protein